MRYVLESNYALRGWERLPHAIVRLSDWGVAFLDARTFQLLDACDGTLDLDSPLLAPLREGGLLEKLAEAGIVRALEPGEEATLRDEQRMRSYGCRFVRRVHWSITGRCNYRCRHCYMDAPTQRWASFPTTSS